MNTTRLRLSALLLSASLLSACGGDSDPGSEASTDAGSDASAVDASADASTPDASAADAGSDDSGTPAETCTGGTITSLSGKILDPAGDPITLDPASNPVTAKAQLCLENTAGNFSCLQPGAAGADGSYSVSVPASHHCSDRVALRALTTTDQPSTYYQLPIASLTGAVTLSAPQTLYTPEAATTSGADSSLQVTLADGSVFSPNTDVFFSLKTGAAFADLQAHKLSATDPLPLGVAAGDYDGMIVFAPEGNIQAAAGADSAEENRLRLNVGAAAAGTTVNVWGQGGLSCERAGDKIEEGVWQQLTATPLTVDASGFVELSLPCLNWVAWKAAE